MNLDLKDLYERREKFGSLGALDFLIDLVEREKRTSNKKEKEIDALELLDLKSVSTPLISEIDTYEPRHRDGSPRKKDLLYKASEVAIEKGDREALAFAQQEIGFHEEYPELALLKANAALSEGNEKEWLVSLSEYLKTHDLAPIQLVDAVGSERFFRVTCEPRRRIYGGPKVSVIIPAYNAEETIEFSVNSILNQSWQNLEVIVVDDVSDDGTWDKLNKLSQTDNRLRIIKNRSNTGPYVAKNIALDQSTGDYVTGHDADDWSHPERIEKQLGYLLQHGAKAGLSYMLRMTPDGRFSYLGKRNSFSPDGGLRKSLVSCIFETKFLKSDLGYWDCVRFGADSEMVSRLEIATGNNVILMPFCSMLCLDLETSLTNNPIFGVDKKTGITKPRAVYKEAWLTWHKSLSRGNTRLGFNEGRQHFSVPPESEVPNL
ncbi:MAG: glycosyltransferase family 2 protein [Gammaproteobacteria bacterium]|nr:glycosyltransferase family 2 protein [Gammaproteobacteria bacterium]